MDRPLAESLIERLGADKIMFGTDYPCTTAKSGLDRFLKLHLSERERKDILYNNADIFFKKYCPNV